MNERIRELAEQAGITTNLETDYYEEELGKWFDYYSEKFAELIIKECIEVSKGAQSLEAAAILTMHFGVR